MATSVPFQLLDSDARGALSGYRNLLCNARFWINQRGYAGGPTTAAKQYTHDRWRLVVQGEFTGFQDMGGDYIGWMAVAPPGGIEQVVERINFIAGKFVLSWQGTASATVNGAPVSKGVPFSVGGGADMVVRFISGTVITPQLECGSVATDFEVLPYVLDLLMCQRYYYRATVNAQSAAIGNALDSIKFPTMMRVTPTETVVAPGTRTGVSLPGGAYGMTPVGAYVPYAATAANGSIMGMVVAFDAEIN